MRTKLARYAALSLLMLLCAAADAGAQEEQQQRQTGSAWMTEAGSRYWVQPDIAYQGASGQTLKLDVWYEHDVKTPQPTLVYIHGGGWVFGTKETSVLQFLPFLERGWRVVNVEYRMASTATAPAAVEDTRCALRWVFRNARQWNFDTTKIVLTGHSAGGHLSLITGMLPEGTGLDNQCYGEEKLSVAAVINWYGITDVNDLIQGANLKNYAVMWVGSRADGAEVARRVSPLSYVRQGLAPVLTIHGDRDDVVPYSHATRLHEALERAKVPNQLFTVRGGGHGGFTQAEYVRSYETIWAFLRRHQIIR